MGDSAANNAKRKAIASKVYGIQNTLRTASGVKSSEFMDYILGFIFYRYLSETFAGYVNEESGIEDSDSPEAYANLSDDDVLEWRENLIAAKGYFIFPSQLFSNMVKNASTNEGLNEDLAGVFRDIEASSKGSASEEDFDGLFDGIRLDNKSFGATVADRNRTLTEIITKIQAIDFNVGGEGVNDVLGDVYETLLGMYANDAGKGGEFYTPQEVSHLLTELVTESLGAEAVGRGINVYDPTCGSGSLLLTMLRRDGVKVNAYYGQELNTLTHNLARMNFFMHGVGFEKFHIAHGDTLRRPAHLDKAGSMQAVVANPPYSAKWDGDSDPILADDERFTPAGRLAPKGYADLAFVMHMLHMMAPGGAAAIVEFPTVLSRGGAEKDIRKYLIEQDYVDAIIQLPKNLFYGTSIATCIIVLKKDKPEERKGKITFVDASSMFESATNMNILTNAHQEEILKLVKEGANIPYKAAVVDKAAVIKNDYTLSVNKYVEMEDTREKIDIDVLEDELDEVVTRQERTRAAILKMTGRAIS